MTSYRLTLGSPHNAVHSPSTVCNNLFEKVDYVVLLCSYEVELIIYLFAMWMKAADPTMFEAVSKPELLVTHPVASRQ